MSVVDPVLRFLPWLVFGQGIFLSIAVLSRWNHTGNRYLGFFLFLLSLHGLVALTWQNPTGMLNPVLSVFMSGLPFLYGPLIYHYVWHSLYRNWDDGKPFIIHALPALINFLMYGGILLLIGPVEYTAIAVDVLEGRGPMYVRAVEYLKVVLGTVYAIFIIRLLRQNKNALSKWAAREQRGRWLRWLTVAFAFNWILVLVSAVMLWSGGFPRDWGLAFTSIQLATFLVFLYMIAFFALRYPSVLNPREIREAIRKKLNLPDGFIEETLKRLSRAETGLFFTDPEITLPSLAKELGLHPNALSYIINEERESGFRGYLNKLRLENFLQLAADAGKEHQNPSTFLEMAFASGFSSKTTFLRAFRQRYGTTPAVYLSK